MALEISDLSSLPLFSKDREKPFPVAVADFRTRYKVAGEQQGGSMKTRRALTRILVGIVVLIAASVLVLAGIILYESAFPG